MQVAGIGVYKEGQEEPNDEAIYEKEFFLASNPRHLDTGSSVPDTSESCLASDNGDGDGNGDAALAPEASHSELREDDVVILDGCFAAAIHWDRFHRVFHVQGHKLLRLLFHLLLRFNILVLIAGIILVAQTALLKQECESWSEIDSDGAHSEKSDDLRPDCPLYFTFWLGLVVLLYSVGMYLASPKIVRFLCGGKFWDTQPWFFGFEGYLPIEEVETLVFGANKGRLSWGSHASSPLSGQTLRANRWIVPSDPCDDSATARLVGKARDAKPGDIRVGSSLKSFIHLSIHLSIYL